MEIISERTKAFQNELHNDIAEHKAQAAYEGHSICKVNFSIKIFLVEIKAYFLYFRHNLPTPTHIFCHRCASFCMPSL